jgi:ribonucleoside-triphosphate reductase
LTLVNPDGSITDPYRNFIAISRYARWREDDLRRETWAETIDRFIEFFREHLSEKFGYDRNAPIFETVREAILNHEVMPSMRAIMTAGEALKRSNIAGYNCSFVAVNHPQAFAEAMFILLNGTGIGFSVERRYVEQLPIVPEGLTQGGIIYVPDSKEGWAHAFGRLLERLYAGEINDWDISDVRPAGSRLKTFGGRASGPAPLVDLFRFTVEVFKKAQGRRLTPLECHDLMCKIGDIVVVGGVRRSALISLSDLGDHDMAKAKSGNWWEAYGHRMLANNSAAYTERPSVTQFLREWRNLIESQSGERGIYNLAGARKHAEMQGRDGSKIAGVNPCGEILLRDQEFCNLTEVVIRVDDTLNDLKRKVGLAAIIGTWQSTLTDFHGLRPDWKKNCEEERLLGVSLTGIYGNRLMNNPHDVRLPSRLRALRTVAHDHNHAEAERLGINPSAAVTCVKPSGTVSQLTGVSSGIHPWFSPYYIRSVRGSNNDPLTTMMRDAGIPSEPDVRKPDDHTVFYFPVKAPDGAVTRDQVSAIEHLELWRVYRTYWTDHNPSITINVKDDEWLEVGAWVYNNWNQVGGISFLPYSDHVYAQAPYQETDEVGYKTMLAKMPGEIRWADLGIYELMDATTGGQELACSAGSGSCELVDIT